MTDIIGKFPRLSEPVPPTTTAGPLQSTYIKADDGTKLALDFLLPHAHSDTTFPTVLMMTRYWRGKVGGTLDLWQTFFTNHNFVVVSGDVRGTGASFGQWPYHRNRAETEDFTAIMDWIVQQPWSDGNVVGMGTSYAANTADWMAERQHPALKAIVPRYADFDPYADLYFPGGVPNGFMGRTWGLRVKELDLNIRCMPDGTFSPGVRPVDCPDALELLHEAIEEHKPVPSVWKGIQEITYRDDRPSSWYGASMTNFGICSHTAGLKTSGVPIQNWAGWMDTGTASGAIHRFLALDDSVHVIIGPWGHAGRHCFDPLQPEQNQIEPVYAVQQAEALLFINECLSSKWKGVQKRLSYYTCGEGRWKTTTVWPPSSTTYEDWNFGPNSTLTTSSAPAGHDTYKVDFEVGTGTTTRWATGQDGTPVFYSDRSEINKRLLCYTSYPLDHGVEITGHPVLTLFMTSTHEDGIMLAYLELVALDGKVLYLTEGQLRLIHRRVSDEEPMYPHVGPHHSFLRKDAMPMVPGEVAEISFELNPLSVLVPKGHCLRIAIAGADKDVFARVPAVGDPSIQIHRGAGLSRLELPIIKRVS